MIFYKKVIPCKIWFNNFFIHFNISFCDITVDEWYGENARGGHNDEEDSIYSGIPIEEIQKGLWPAIDEFLISNPEWVLHERFTNNNGLTILKKIRIILNNNQY